MLRRVTQFTLALVALATVLVLILKLALSQVSHYEDDIVGYLSELVGAELQVGTLQAVLSGIEPLVELSEVSVVSPSQETLHVGRVRVEFDLWRSLLRRQPAISDLRVADIRLLVVTDTEGHASIVGVPLPLLGAGMLGQSQSGSKWSALNVYFEQAKIRWRNEQMGTDYEFENVSTAFESSESRVSWAVKLTPPPALGRQLHWVAEFEGSDGTATAQWDGRMYLRADQADLALWARLLGREGVVEGVMSGELWSDWRAGGLRRVSGALACRACVANHLGTLSGQTHLAWEAHTEGWRQGWRGGLFDATLDASVADRAIALEDSDVALDYRGADSQLLLQTAKLNPLWLDAFNALSDRIKVSAAQGEVGLSAVFSHADFIPPVAKPHKGASWRHGFAERVRFATEYLTEYADHFLRQSALSTAQLRLNLRDSVFQLPTYSQNTLRLDELAASLRYFKRSTGYDLHIERLSARTAGARVHGEVVWLGTAPPQTQVALGVEQLPLVEVKRWLPESGLRPRLRAWLAQAFVAGTLKTGRLALEGTPSAFPFKKGDGRLHFSGEVADAELNYRAQREPLRELAAHVMLDNQLFAAEASQLSYYGVRSQAARVVIQDVAQPFIEVDAHGTGRLAGMLAYLKDARLMSSGNASLGALEPQGEGSLALSVAARLSKRVQKDTTVEGALRVDGAGLRVNPDFVFSDVTGVLSFDRDGVRAEALTAQINDIPLQVDVAPVGERMPGATALTLRGEAAPSQWPRLSDARVSEVVEGTTPWRAEVLIPSWRKRAGELQVKLASSLEGVTVKLPAPFGKGVTQRRDFLAEMTLGRQRAAYDLSYGEAIRARWVKEAGTPPWGYLHFGETPPAPPQRGVFKLSGEITEAVEADDWLQLRSGNADFGAAIRHVDLSLADLRKSGKPLGASALVMQPREGGRELRIAAAWAQGRVFLPDADDTAVFAQLDRLFLPAGTSLTRSTLQPATMPAFELEVADFRRGDMALSQLNLVTEPIEGGLRIGRLAFELGEVLMAMDGQWLFDGQRHQTTATLDMNGRDYGRALELLGFASSFKEGDGALTGRVTWAGPPSAFAIKNLEGDIRLDLREGVIEKADPGVSRVLGLFSVNHIVRRLTLDFRDVVGKGLVFETMEGNLKFGNGVMRTEDLVIVGSSISMAISGDNFIAEKRYDQQIEVVPNLSSGLPVAGALLGGPITGAAVLLIDKLTQLGSRMDKIVTLRYRLHGSWDDPQIDFEQAPEAAKESGKIKRLFEKALP